MEAVHLEYEDRSVCGCPHGYVTPIVQNVTREDRKRRISVLYRTASDYDVHTGEPYDREVFGNIYENPEEAHDE